MFCLQVEVEFKLNFVEDVMSVNGSLKDFQLYVAPNFPNHTEENKALVSMPSRLLRFPIRVKHCLQLAHTFLNFPLFWRRIRFFRA